MGNAAWLAPLVGAALLAGDSGCARHSSMVSASASAAAFSRWSSLRTSTGQPSRIE